MRMEMLLDGVQPESWTQAAELYWSVWRSQCHWQLAREHAERLQRLQWLAVHPAESAQLVRQGQAHNQVADAAQQTLVQQLQQLTSYGPALNQGLWVIHDVPATDRMQTLTPADANSPDSLIAAHDEMLRVSSEVNSLQQRWNQQLGELDGSTEIDSVQPAAATAAELFRVQNQLLSLTADYNVAIARTRAGRLSPNATKLEFLAALQPSTAADAMFDVRESSPSSLSSPPTLTEVGSGAAAEVAEQRFDSLAELAANADQLGIRSLIVGDHSLPDGRGANILLSQVSPQQSPSADAATQLATAVPPGGLQAGDLPQTASGQFGNGSPGFNPAMQSSPALAGNLPGNSIPEPLRWNGEMIGGRFVDGKFVDHNSLASLPGGELQNPSGSAAITNALPGTLSGMQQGMQVPGAPVVGRPPAAPANLRVGQQPTGWR